MNKHFDWIPAPGDWVSCGDTVFQVHKRLQVTIGGWLHDIKLKDAAGNAYLLSQCSPAQPPVPLRPDEIQTCVEMCRAMMEADPDLGNVRLFRHLSPEDLDQIFSQVDPLIREEFEAIAAIPPKNDLEAIGRSTTPP